MLYPAPENTRVSAHKLPRTHFGDNSEWVRTSTRWKQHTRRAPHEPPPIPSHPRLSRLASVTLTNKPTVCGQVHNISPVIAEWDFKRLFGDPRDEAKFKLTPKGGSLHRDQRVNVQVNHPESQAERRQTPSGLQPRRWTAVVAEEVD